MFAALLEDASVDVCAPIDSSFWGCIYFDSIDILLRLQIMRVIIRFVLR